MFVCARCLALREEQRLGLIEKRALRKVFGTKWQDVTGEWIRLYN